MASGASWSGVALHEAGHYEGAIAEYDEAVLTGLSGFLAPAANHALAPNERMLVPVGPSITSRTVFEPPTRDRERQRYPSAK